MLKGKRPIVINYRSSYQNNSFFTYCKDVITCIFAGLVSLKIVIPENLQQIDLYEDSKEAKTLGDILFSEASMKARYQGKNSSLKNKDQAVPKKNLRIPNIETVNIFKIWKSSIISTAN